MAKVRVYELAKALGVDSKELLKTINDMGEFVRSASSTVEPPVVRKLREHFASAAPAGAVSAPAKKAASSSGAPKPGAPRPKSPAAAAAAAPMAPMAEPVTPVAPAATPAPSAPAGRWRISRPRPGPIRCTPCRACWSSPWPTGARRARAAR